ncbi:MAG: hypothetical protein HYV19_06915 [Gemmatimonadetes bacterium]|nr:hypothetical protein [Gemmatimonadota bacterium]
MRTSSYATARLLRAALTLLLSIPAASRAQSPAVPTPESVFGFSVGADFKLIDYEQSVAYFQRLAAVSNRIKLFDVGKTSGGKAWTLAVISSPENLARLDRLRDIAQQLAHPAGLSDAQARALTREGRAFVDISGGLHASEIAGSQHTIQLAFDLLSRNDEKTRAILDNTVLLLWPSLNPDGQDIVVNWYRKNVGTPYEVSQLDTLYQKYIGHDNNRDAYMLNVVESRVVARTWRQWEPQIIYVHHQTAPFPTRIWLPPFAEPIAPRAPALMSREVNTIGMTIAQALETNGQVGATHMGTGFDAWYPGYIDYMPMLQNIASYWTETALFAYATPKFYTTAEFPAEYRDLRAQSLYASPWPGGWWRLRDAVDYMETASLATLDYASKYREELQWNRYQAGRNTIARYSAAPPYAYVVPSTQRDPAAAVALLRRLAFLGVQVQALAREATYGGTRYAKGSWVVPLNQEYGELVRQLFDVQQYPDLREGDGGAPEPPYDAAGWTLPYLADVRVVEARVALPADFRAAMQPVKGTPVDPSTADAPLTTNATAAGIVPPPARLSGAGDAFAVDPAQNDAFRFVNRALAAGGRAQFDGGRYVVTGVSVPRLEGWANELALRVERRASGGAGGAIAAKRVALFQPLAQSMDGGWTAWLLDQHEFAYTAITRDDVLAGNLSERFDVILFASDAARSLVRGAPVGSVPPAIEGGLGDAGVRALDAFVRAGGTVVAVNQGAVFAVDALHLPVKNVVQGVPSRDFFASGSILEVLIDTTHPVMAGMPDRAKIFFDRSPAFSTSPGFEGTVLARYATAGSPLLSGYLLGEKYLQGAAAALDVKHERGRVVLIGFRPQWRGQTIGTFRVLLNAAFYRQELAMRVAPTKAPAREPARAPAPTVSPRL